MTDFKELPKKQQDIVTTATELFQRHGMKRITIEEICSKSSVSKMTFYKYFENKMELVKFVFKKMIDEGWNTLGEFEKKGMSFPEKLKEILKIKQEFGEKFSPEFIEEYIHATPELAPFLGEIIQESMIRYRQFIVEAQQRGDVRKDLNPDFLIAISSKLYDWVKEGNWQSLFEDFSDMAVQVNALLFYGILPREDCDE